MYKTQSMESLLHSISLLRERYPTCPLESNEPERVPIIKSTRKCEIKFDKCTIDLTVGPVVQDSAFNGLAHQGQFFPLSQSSQGSSQVPETAQLPSASGQNGGMHSQVQLTWLNMPLAQPAVGMSHRNSFPDTIAITAAMVAEANSFMLCSASCGLCSL